MNPEQTQGSDDAQSLPLDTLISLGMAAQRLKQVPRTGWLLRGVPRGEAESVAEHSYGMAVIALALAETLSEPLDRGRLLAICLLHDLAEAILGDWPGPTTRYLPPGAKQDAEAGALKDLLQGLPFAEQWLSLWQDYQSAATMEGKVARDADKLDMVLQAAAYEKAGRRGLDEFWEGARRHDWHLPDSAALVRRLVEARNTDASGTQP